MTQFSSEKKYYGNIRVNACGSEFLHLRDYNTIREEGRVDYLFNYITDGVGYYEANGKTKKFSKGDLLIYPPNVRQHYFFNKEDQTKTFWCHFSGKYSEMLNITTSTEPILISIKNVSSFESAFKRLVNAFYLREPFFEKTCEGYLTVLITLVARELNFTESKASAINNKRLEQVLNEMHTNFSSAIDINYYAKICNLSKTRFLHIFKERLGVSPYHYQIEIRIARAVELLESSDISISECARRVGFNDVSYFCRIFKKITGKTPSYFKK